MKLSCITLYKNNLGFFQRSAKFSEGEKIEGGREFKLEIPLDLKNLV